MVKLYLIILFCFAPFKLSTGQELTIEPVRNLNFNDEIFPGIEKSVDHTSSDAAQFIVTGESGREVILTFQLPDVLNDDMNNMFVSFSPTDAGYSTLELAGAAEVFDPNNEQVATLSVEGKLHIWLGGTVHPAANQPGNVYSGDIHFEVSYTGN